MEPSAAVSTSQCSSSDFAKSTSKVHSPPFAVSVSMITNFLAMFIKYCGSSAFDASHSGSLSMLLGETEEGFGADAPRFHGFAN